MSNALAIASVTHVLKDLLNDGLINQNVSAALGSAVQVTSLPPGQIESQQGSASSQLNIFMYRVSHNTGWKNTGFPSRDDRGQIVSNPPLALDLHYLLTAYGEDELHAEILLGYGMQLLHENPVLGRDAIRSSLTPATVSDPSGRLPSRLLALAGSGLAEQIEQIKITPEPINTEEISKLWNAFQAKYRPCTAYLATVVLIESDKPTRSSLPVMKRNVYAVSFRQPVINNILSHEDAPNATVSGNRRIVTGDVLVLQGEQLKSEGVLVRVGKVDIAPDAANVSATQISLKLEASLGLKAGVQGVQVVQPIIVSEDEPPGKRGFRGAYSSLQSFVLSPEITGTQVVTNPIEGSTLRAAEITTEVNPAIHKGQRVLLLLNETSLAAGEKPVSYSFPLPAEQLATNPVPVDSVTFNMESGIAAGDYLVRIEVDGAGSPLTTNTEGEFDGPQINIS